MGKEMTAMCVAAGVATAALQARMSPSNGFVGAPQGASALKALPFREAVSAEDLHSGKKSGNSGLTVAALAGVASTAACLRKRIKSTKISRRATQVVAESKTNLAPWEIEEETNEEKESRYKRDAEELKLKWDSRKMENELSRERRIAYSKREAERALYYGPRDLVMEAYEARMYQEARVLEVRRRQWEVYERSKAFKEGRELPPKGTPFVPLKFKEVEPVRPEDFDISGRYLPHDDVEAQQYKAPATFKSTSGSAPPPAHMRGAPRAAWESPPYGPPSGQTPRSWPTPGSVPPSGWKSPLPDPSTPIVRTPAQLKHYLGLPLSAEQDEVDAALAAKEGKPQAKKAAKAPAAKQATAAVSDAEEEEEEAPKKKATPKKQVEVAEATEDEEEEEAPKKKATAKKKVVAEVSDDEEAPAPKKKASTKKKAVVPEDGEAPAPKKKVVKKKAAAEE